MFVEERQAAIMEELRAKGRVRVKELSERFAVSEDLIRKDLSALEQKGLLKKAYGGAVLQRENIHQKRASQRKQVHIEEKKQIAQKACQLIHDNDVIFLDITTISIAIARHLVEQQMPITVVTNMLDVVEVLAKSSISVIFIGGEFDYGRDGFVGSLAAEQIRRFRFDLAFLGVVGIDVHENSVMTYMANDGLTKAEIIAASKHAYMVCEHDKFEQSGNYCYATLDDFTGIVLDALPAADVVKVLQEHELEVKTAK